VVIYLSELKKQRLKNGHRRDWNNGVIVTKTMGQLIAIVHVFNESVP